MLEEGRVIDRAARPAAASKPRTQSQGRGPPDSARREDPHPGTQPGALVGLPSNATELAPLTRRQHMTTSRETTSRETSSTVWPDLTSFEDLIPEIGR